MFAITYRKVFLAITAVIMLGSALIVLTLGLKPGIDFTGGALTEVVYETVPTQAEIEVGLEPLALGGISVRETMADDGRSGYIIRTRNLADEERAALDEIISAVGQEADIIRYTSIGPVIGEELKDKAGWAVFGVVSIIVLYVAFAFAGIGTPVSSWVYGLITIFVLVHDVLVPTAVMSLLGHFVGSEVDVLFVMAVLAVLGYSVNDTIVVFDRVRENLKLNRTEHRKKHTEPGGLVREEVTYTLTKPYEEIVGTAVRDTMARSINTSLTTLLALLALYFFGGATTQIFTLMLLVGVIAGTYSSICIASPLVVTYALHKAAKRSSL